MSNPKWLVALALTVAAIITFGFAASADGDQPVIEEPPTCEPKAPAPGYSGKIDTTGEPKTVTVTAPEGNLIYKYCVKAGSVNQGLGPVYVDVDPPQESVTISYPNGKDISHYSYWWRPSSTTTSSSSTSSTSSSTTSVVSTTTVPDQSTTSLPTPERPSGATSSTSPTKTSSTEAPVRTTG